LILSGFADRELILKWRRFHPSIPGQACDAESLKATLARASNLESALHNERLKTLVLAG